MTKEQSEALIDILEILHSTIVETEEIISHGNDPTSPYRELLDKLNGLQEELNRIKSGQLPYDPERISRINNDIIGIQTNIKNPVDRVLSADVFFALGKYRISDLSQKGKEALDEFAGDVIRLQVNKLRQLFPDKPLVIIIKSVGYADETPMSRGFAQNLSKDMDVRLPADPVEKRKILNKELSFRRAKSIFQYLKMQLNARVEMVDVTIDRPKIIGMGEEFPYSKESVSPPYSAKDKRRRICKIHGNVFVSSF